MSEAGLPDRGPSETPAAPDLPPAGRRPTPAAAPHLMHGFLFADLRDYTGYVEAHGDHAGALLLERYRLLVRGAVAAALGAEIRTEGDSFYVVFDSASAAVRAGLEIVAAAAAADPADPIHVGLGIHAGETVETAEGYVGSAVNIAARVCSQAQAGELVVSDTVRALVRTYLDVEFEPLGARRLKGVPEPLGLYRVIAGSTARRARSPWVAGLSRSRLLTVGVAAAVILAVVAGVLLLGGSRAAPTDTPAVSPVTAAAAATAAATRLPASTSSASHAAGTPASSGPFPNVAEAAILAALPPDLARTCVRGGTPDDARLAGFAGKIGDKGYFQPPTSVTPDGSLGGVTCHPATGAMRLYVIAPVSPSFENLKGLGVYGGNSGSPADVYLGYMAAIHQLPFGSCASDKQAYELWSSPSGIGQLACMNPYDGRPWIYFTFGKGRYLAFATRDDSNYGALYAWWEQLKTFLP